MKDKLNIFIPLTKVDVEKRLVYGVATAESVDKYNEVCDYATTKPYYEKWSGDIAKATDGKSVGNLRSMHDSIAAGKLTQIAFDDENKKIEVCAKVVDDGEWNKVIEGVYTGFSQGGKYVKRWKDPSDPKLMRYTAEPVEISLVDNPCLPEATFTMVKADGSEELRKFKTVETVEPTNDEIAAKAKELAKAAGDETKWQDHIDAARDDLKKIAEPAQKAEKAAEEAQDENWEQVWVHPKLPGQSFAKKSDLKKALIDLDVKKEVEKQVAPVMDALKGISDMLDKKTKVMNREQIAEFASKWKAGELVPEAFLEGLKKLDAKDPVVAYLATVKPEEIDMAKLAELAKKEYSDDERKKMAKEGVAMPDGSFPIPDKAALEDAIKAFGRAKNKAAAKRHIIRRAKALKATDLLPADWPGSTKGKDTPEKAAEGDLKKSLWIVAELVRLLASIESLEECYECDTIRINGAQNDVTQRFVALVVELGDVTAEILDACLANMREEEVSEAMEMAARIELLAKAGARHSKKDQDLLNKAHDALVDAGAECNGGAAEKGAVPELQKRLDAEREAFTKQLTGIAEMLKTIGERVKNIEEQPMPGRPAEVRTVEKSEDMAGAITRADTLLETPGMMELMAELAIRRAHGNPVRAVPGVNRRP